MAISLLPAADRATALRWRPTLLTLAVVVSGVLLLFAGTAAGMVTTWWTVTTYGHCFLIPLIVAWLVRHRWPELRPLAPVPCWWGLAPLALAALLWLVAHAVAVQVAQQLALVAMLQAAALLVLGARLCRALLFPLLYLYLMVPAGEALVPPLQDFTARFIVAGLRLSGIPVFHDGILISIPAGDFLVAEACAGLRFLTATVALGLLFAHLTYRSWTRRAAFMALAVTVPVIANGVRAFGIVMIAHWSDMRLAVDVDHLVYGWAFFALITVLLMLVGLPFREPEAEPAAVVPEPAGRPGQPVAAGTAGLALAALVAGYAGHLDARTPTGPVAALVPPQASEPWRLAAAGGGTLRPRFIGADAQLDQVYVDATNAEAELFVAVYRRQHQGAELVSSDNALATDPDLGFAARGTAQVLVDGAPLEVAVARFHHVRGGGRLVWHWYRVDGRFTASPYLTKLLQAKATLLGGDTLAVAIVLAAPYDDDPAEAEAALQGLLTHTEPLGPWLTSGTAS